MCLAKVDPEPKTNRKSGYKVVVLCDGGKIEPQYGVGHYVINEWMEDPADLIRNGYRTGFHIFLSLRGAISWKGTTYYLEIRKVRFDDVVATGMQRDRYKEYRCVVARKICIGEVVNV